MKFIIAVENMMSNMIPAITAKNIFTIPFLDTAAFGLSIEFSAVVLAW